MVKFVIERKARRPSRSYLLIAAFAAAGCIFLLLDHGEYDAAATFNNAVECADSSSDHCYQLYPGVIQTVRIFQTSSGEQDVVDIASRGSTVHISVQPSLTDAPLLQVGTPVTVEWYVGSVSTVWIGNAAIPSTSSLAKHPDFAYIGWLLLWLAALFWAIVLLNWRMVALFAAVKVLPATAEVQALAAREVMLPGGTTGWVAKPRVNQAVLLPLVFAALVSISLRLLLNAGSRPLALAGDVFLFVPAIAGLALSLRNDRLMADHASLTKMDLFGRMRSWPIAEIEQAAIVGLQWTDWAVPALLFVGRGGTELFRVTSLYWNLDEIGAICVKVGVPLTVGYLPRLSKRAKRLRFAIGFVGALISGAFLVVSFLPLPPA
ncbi:MAG: hypothetical protein ACHP7F_11880 [Actinomycetales bacterium]